MNKEKLENLSVHDYLYLHPSENINITLVSLVFDLTNYDSLSHFMIITLSTKK